MRSKGIRAGLLTLAVVSVVNGQQLISDQQLISAQNVTGPMMNKQDISVGAPLIQSDLCKYNFYEEKQTLSVNCFDSEGMLVGQQLRSLQNAHKECAIVNDVYMPAMSFSELSEFFVREHTGSYICCDFYEPGFGYLFTDCGGSKVVIVNDKKQSVKSQDFQAMGISSSLQGGAERQIWNWTELELLVKGKCNNTYIALDEYLLAGGFQYFWDLDFPWQKWMVDNQITDLKGLQTWIMRYYDFIIAYVKRLQEIGAPEDVTAQFLSILELFPANVTNMTITELVQNNTELLQSVSTWLKTVQAQIVNRQQGLTAIEPGYRAIVKWAKDRISQEIYKQIRDNITASLNQTAIPSTLPANEPNSSSGGAAESAPSSG